MLGEIRELFTGPRGRPAGSRGRAYLPVPAAASSCPVTASGSGTAA